MDVLALHAHQIVQITATILEDVGDLHVQIAVKTTVTSVAMADVRRYALHAQVNVRTDALAHVNSALKLDVGPVARVHVISPVRIHVRCTAIVHVS